MVGAVSSPDSDPVLAAVEQGSFSLPAEGRDEHGVRWVPIEPDAGGSLGTFGAGIIYAVARFDLSGSAGLLARTERTLGVYANGVLQPGDVYGSRRMRVPLAGRAGENLVVLRALGGRGAVEVELFTTEDEVLLNLADPTTPDPVEGRSDELHLGLPLLNLSGRPLRDLSARVVGDDSFEETTTSYPSIGPGAVTGLAFRVRPRRPFGPPGQVVLARLQVSSPSLGLVYERPFELTTVAATGPYRQTFLSPGDGSVQYYAVLPPSGYDPSRSYGLVLSLHGAGVEAIGQAGAYSARDWAFVVAPTNRRPFGFDWEEWGRINALESLEDAMARLPVDPTRVHLTGHSMGGHGTWHVGVTTPGRFATVGPSAGWGSFYSYTGDRRPTGAFARARAHSDTLVYLGNLARRAVYVLHGSADDNVPVREGRDMSEAARAVTDDVVYHEEPGVGHWWDGDAAPGVDCVDWPPLFELMEARRLDPYELDFAFRSPSPSYAASHSFVTLESAADPYEDCTVSSERTGSTVVVATVNVRRMTLDGTALGALGIETVEVDGETFPVAHGPIAVGPDGGKDRETYGPFNQAFRRPFCFVYPADDRSYAEYAAYLVSYWSVIGNGHACAVPSADLDEAVRTRYGLVHLGPEPGDLGGATLPFSWDESSVSVAERRYERAGLLFVFPDGERLAAGVVVTPGSERLLYSIVPFSSRSGLPDYMVWSDGGVRTAGFLDAGWDYDPTLASP